MGIWRQLSIFTAFALLAAGLAYAQGISGVGEGAKTLYCALVSVLPIVSMLMIIGAGVVYAAGQIMGAETRARASQWATAMLIGAVIGILIVTVAPTVLGAMYGSGWVVPTCV